MYPTTVNAINAVSSSQNSHTYFSPVHISFYNPCSALTVHFSDRLLKGAFREFERAIHNHKVSAAFELTGRNCQPMGRNKL